MKLIIHKPITTELRSPFWLTKVPKVAHSTRRKFACGYRAMAELESLAKTMSESKFYGADVCDDNGVMVAEVE